MTFFFFTDLFVLICIVYFLFGPPWLLPVLFILPIFPFVLTSSLSLICSFIITVSLSNSALPSSFVFLSFVFQASFLFLFFYFSSLYFLFLITLSSLNNYFVLHFLFIPCPFSLFILLSISFLPFSVFPFPCVSQSL